MGSNSGSEARRVLVSDEPTDTQRLLSALREEERRYRTLVETNPVPIWQVDEHGRVVYANQALADLVQRASPEELLGVSYRSFFPTKDLEVVDRERERRLVGESSTYEVTVLGSRGKLTPVLLHGSPLQDDAGRLTGIIGCLVDVSELTEARNELRRAGEGLEAEVAARTRELDRVNLQLAQELSDCERFEAALLESEKRYRLVSELTSDYVYSAVVDPDGTAHSIWTTASFERIVGRQRGEMETAGGWLKMIHPSDLERASDFAAKLRANQSGKIEYRIVRPDGTVRWLSDHVHVEWSETEQRVVRLYGAVRDITESRAAEEALRRHQEVLEQRVAERTEALQELTHRLQAEIRERQQAESQQRRISGHLREVLAAADELLQCPDEDTLCLRAVELARERLGVERASLFLFDPDGATARGTYGTNLAGRTTREHQNVIRPEVDLCAYIHRPVQESPHCYILTGPHQEWDDEEGIARTVGEGEIAVNEIRSAGGPIGLFFNDQARTGLPLDPNHQQAVAVYCQWLGSIIQQRRANAARAQSDHQFRAIFDNALEAMVLLSDEGLCLELNRAAETLLGASTEEVRGRSVYDYLALEGDRESYWSDFLSSGAETGELVVRRFDGRAVPTEYGAIANVVPGKHLAVLRDISARKEAEERRQALIEGLRTIAEIADQLLSCATVRDVCRRTVELARERLGIERIGVFLNTPEHGVLQGIFGTDEHGNVVDESGSLRRLRPSTVAALKIALTQRPRWTTVPNQRRTTWRDGQVVDVEPGPIACTPLVSNGQLIGALFNDRYLTNLPLDETQQELLAGLASTLGNIIRRRDAEEQVRESELHFRSLIENSDEVISLLDAEGRIKYVSQSAKRVLGYEPQSLVGRHIFEFVHPEDSPVIAAALSRAINDPGPPQTFEPRIRHCDGRWLIIEARSTNHLANPAIGGIVVNKRDITARRRTERLLAGQRRILELIARSVPLNEILDQIVIQIEEIADGVRGSIHLCRGDQLYSASAPHLPSDFTQIAAIVPIRDDEGSCGTAAFRRSVVIVKDIAKSRLWNGYREAALANGLRACWSSPIFARDGRILGSFALYRDQPGGPDDTERELVEVATSLAGIAIERAQSEERLRLIESAVHYAHDAILIATAGPQPRTVYVNPAMASMTGYGLEELYRRRPGLLPGASESRQLVEALEQGDSLEYSGQAQRKDGSDYSAEWTVSPVRDSDGAVSHWVWVERDVTARHRLEEQLRQSLKMDAIGRLAGGVAHDFNNLLAVIGGYSDLLLEEAEPGSRQRAGLEEIRKAAERAASLTRQLLAFARRDVIAPRSLDLNAIVRDMESMLRPLIGEHIEMHALLDPNLPPIRVDAGQMEQVVMNLAVNARDAMPQGGKLTWETGTLELDENAAATLGLKPATYVALTASDTGLGIPDEVLPHIFEPFYTTKERGKGTGLGLATVYAIVIQNRGQIRVASEPGCGTRFEIYFPADTSRRRAEPIEPGKAATSPIENLTVLLVEDEPQVRRLTAEVLRTRGHTVMEAERGDAALQFAAHFPGEIDLLLADVMMPGMNGREVADRLVRMRPETRVLFMSGYMDESVPKVGEATDNDGFLQKPFTPDQLLTKIQERMGE